MSRPLTRIEESQFRRRSWWEERERVARAERGEKGVMEFWLALARAVVEAAFKAGYSDVYSGFAAVCRLYLAAQQKREDGDPRVWNDLMQYASQVAEQVPLRH